MQEQEKQRGTDKKKEEADKKSLEKKKEEMDDEVQKMHVKLKQKQQRWDRECVAREKQQVNLKSLGLPLLTPPLWLYHHKNKTFC